MSTEEVNRLRAQLAEAERRSAMSVLSALPAMSDEALRGVAGECEDAPRFEAGSCGQAVRLGVICVHAEAANLLGRRAEIQQARQPGAHPGALFRTGSSFRCPAEELRPGDVLRHQPRPGRGDLTHLEVVEVNFPAATVWVRCRPTNTDEAGEWFAYPRGAEVDRYRPGVPVEVTDPSAQ